MSIASVQERKDDLKPEAAERGAETAAYFEAAALPHLNDLFRAALHTLGNRGDAEEIVQETCLQAWKSFHRFEPGTNCRAWLFRIMFHVIHHHRRKWSRFIFQPTIETDSFLEETLVYQEPVPEHISDGDVLAALDHIPVRYREVILLVDVQEFTYKEAAAILNIPAGTVMSRLNRGRKLLKQELLTFAASYLRSGA